MPNLTTTTLSTLSAEITVLTSRLKPVDHATVAKALVSMQTAGMIMPTNIKPEDVEQVYGFALEKVPAFGLATATRKLIKGEYEHISREFIPRPPELAAMARAESRALIDDLARLRLTEKSLLDSKPPEPPNEAAKERVRKMLGRFRADHRASKATEATPTQLDDDKAEYFRAIMALNDSPKLDHEHLAYRRKIETMIGEEK